MTSRYRYWPGVSEVCLAILLTGFHPSSSPAQETVAEADAVSDEVYELVVTGTRIRRPGVDTFYPAIAVDSEEISDGAFSNIAEVLNDIPAFGEGLTPYDSQNTLTNSQSFVDFLGLGPQRTLILVNGRRFISANAPSNFGGHPGLHVDLNTIPAALVDRVETIGVGGAPIYGTDAIAGTVNIILKDRYEGVDLLARSGLSGEGDAAFHNVSVVAGANFANERGNVTMSLETYRQDGLLLTDRPGLSEDKPFWGNNESRDPGDPSSINVRRIYSDQRTNIFTMGGLIDPVGFTIPSFGIGAMPDGNFYQFDAESNLVRFNPGQPYAGSPLFALGGDGFSFWPEVQQARSPVDRDLATVRLNFDVTSRIRFSTDVLMADSRATELSNQGGFQTWVFGGTSAPLLFRSDNPFLHPEAQTTLQNMGATQFYVHRFLNDIVNSSTTRDQQQWHATIGLDGDLLAGERNLYWSIYASRGRSDADTRQEGIIDPRFSSAIDPRLLTGADLALIDPDPLIAEQLILQYSGTSTAGDGDIVCESVFQAALNGGIPVELVPGVQGCVPLNLFGEGARAQSARDWVTGYLPTRSTTEQTIISANFGGDLVELPAGLAAFNVGVEAREESAAFEPTVDAAALGLRTIRYEATSGEYDTREVFGEVVIPVLGEDMGIAAANLLELSGAVRYVDNSYSGSDTVWTVGLRYSPHRDFVVRANYTESARAPAIAELFAPRRSISSSGEDPCDSREVNGGPEPGRRAMNCAADIPNYDPLTFQSNLYGGATNVPGTAGGNPDLTNEQAESWSVGLTFEPGAADKLLLTADYINIEAKGWIQEVGITWLMRTCYDAEVFPDAAPCNMFTRDSAGLVESFTQDQFNAAAGRFESLQMAATYDFELASVAGALNEAWRARNIGSLQTRLRLDHVINRELSLIGEPGRNFVGGFADPEWSGSLDLTWQRENWRLFWRVLWQRGALLDPLGDDHFEDPNGNLVARSDDRYISNVALGYRFDRFAAWAPESTRIQLSVTNLFGRQGDLIQRASNHLHFHHEVLGRTYTLTLQGSW